MLKDYEDAFGHEIYDYFHEKGGYEIVERDDGFFGTSAGPKHYFMDYEEWPESEKEAMRYVRGRALDVGCGAGRHSLYLQAQGHDVVGIDSSPLAIEVCKARGLSDARVLPITRVSRQVGVFDTILMLGNNFCLMKRSGKRPNKISQSIKDLQPGRTYSFRMFSADRGNYHKKQDLTFRFSFEGCEVVRDGSFRHVFRNPWHGTKEFPRNKVWMNYHVILFRALNDRCRLVISDWIDDLTPEGPIGQETIFNFVQIRPYLDE